MHKVKEYTYNGHKVKIEVQYPISEWKDGATTVGNVAAVGTVQITAVGADGDIIEATVDEGSGAAVIGTYTKQTGDTVDDIAAGLAANINTDTDTHGYSSISSTDTVSITAPVVAGAAANAYTLATNITGTMTDSVVTFAAGTTGSITDVYKVEMTAIIDGHVFEKLIDDQSTVTSRLVLLEEAIKQTIDTFISQEAIEASTFTPMLTAAEFIDKQ